MPTRFVAENYIWLRLCIVFAVVAMLLLPVVNSIKQVGSVNSATERVIETTEDAASIINGRAAGTSGQTFVFQPGIHRIKKAIMGRANDRFIGRQGAVLRGTRVVQPTEWTQLRDSQNNLKSVWYLTGQTQNWIVLPSSDNFNGTPLCQSNYPNCRRSDLLFLNDNILTHENFDSDKNQVFTSLAVGEWYFDYDADRVYLGESPAGKNIELTVADYAFLSGNHTQVGAPNIIIANLIIERFAPSLQNSAVSLWGTNALIEHNEIRYNHASGVSAADDSIIRNNYIHHNGMSGFGGRGKNLRVERNEVAFNNFLRLPPQWDGGGSKVTRSDGLLVKENYTHDNYGPGFWTDIDNIRSIYEGNVIINNIGHGIEHEISYDAVIRNNFIANNRGSGDSTSNQVFVQVSKNVTVHGNTIIVPAAGGAGVYLQGEPRSDDNPTKWETRNAQVFDNNIYAASTKGWYVAAQGRPNTVYNNFEEVAATSKVNGNRYYITDPSTNRWGWGTYGVSMNWNSLRQQCRTDQTDDGGQFCVEEDGSVITSGFSVPSAPAWNFVRGQVANYGDSQPDTEERGPYSGTPIAIPGRIEAENFDKGPAGAAYLDKTANNEGSQYRSTGVDIKTVAGGYAVGWFQRDEWLEFTVNVTAPGVYYIKTGVHSVFANRQLQLAVGGATISTIAVPQVADWAASATVEKGRIQLSAGEQVVRITNTGEDFADLDYIEFISVEPGCMADYNDDGGVGLGDLSQFVRYYKSTTPDCSFDVVNNDCRIDAADLAAFIGVYRQENSCR